MRRSSWPTQPRLKRVFYLKAVPWEVPDFTVDRYFDRLLAMHALIKAEGHLDVGFH